MGYSKANKMMSERKWVETFFDICNVIAKKSKDPSTKVGCIITSEANSIISAGFNGFPIGVKDDLEIKCGDEIKKSERYLRPQKYFWTSHAEENAIAFAARNGVSTNGATLYVNRMLPCTRCTRLIIQSGIKKIYVMQDAPKETIERWKEDSTISTKMLEEAGVELVIIGKNLVK